MRVRMAAPLTYFFRVSAMLVAVALLGVMVTTSGADEGNTTRVSVDSSGNQANGFSDYPSINADGRYVAFTSWATDLVANDTNDTNDIFVHDRETGTTELVSVDNSGNQANKDSGGPSISADGRFVAFGSWASSLVADDTNVSKDVFVHDRRTGTTELVSVDSSGNQANKDSSGPSISADGRFVAFTSWAPNLVANDTNDTNDIFVHDRETGTTELVSVDNSGNQANKDSGTPSISADGRFVAFASWATDLVAKDTNDTKDVFVHDRQTGTTRRVSVGNSGNQASGYSYDPSINADGRFVAFTSRASNLVANDACCHDVFVRDQQMGTTRRVSVASSGSQANGVNNSPSISSNGRFVAFGSMSSNLVANDTNKTWDVFVRDQQTGTTRRVSVASSGSQANGSNHAFSSISSDGHYLAFRSNATNLVPNDTNAAWDIFVHERDTSAPRVMRVVPTEGATAIALKADVVATFSEKMEKSTLKKANFKLYKLVKNPNGTTSAQQITNVTVTPSSDGLKATLNPYGETQVSLTENTRYKAVVSGGTLDVFGNRLDQNPNVSGNQPKVWFFKTRN